MHFRGGGREEATYLPLCLLQLEQVSEGENLELSSAVKPIMLGPPAPPHPPTQQEVKLAKEKESH